jgi:hypothetical protein
MDRINRINGMGELGGKGDPQKGPEEAKREPEELTAADEVDRWLTASLRWPHESEAFRPVLVRRDLRSILLLA